MKILFPKIRKAESRYYKNNDNLSYLSERHAIEYGSKDLGKKIVGEKLQRKVK